MTRRRLYPAKPNRSTVVTSLSLGQLRGLGDAPVCVSLATEEHGLYRWGTLNPLASAYNTRAWLYVPDYASPERPPALVYAKTDAVEVWRLAITAG